MISSKNWVNNKISECEDPKKKREENVLRGKYLRYLAHTSLWDDTPLFNLVKRISRTYSWLSVNGNN